MESQSGWFERQSRNTRRDINTMPTWLLGSEGAADRARLNRSERIQALIQFFSSSFLESYDDRTPFDLDVIKILTELRDKYS